jgi:hypothetical protein
MNVRKAMAVYFMDHMSDINVEIWHRHEILIVEEVIKTDKTLF